MFTTIQRGTFLFGVVIFSTAVFVSSTHAQASPVPLVNQPLAPMSVAHGEQDSRRP
jgi:hypothetical protein